jgi:hypothetical protein
VSYPLVMKKVSKMALFHPPTLITGC